MNVDLNVATRTSTRSSNQPQIGSRTKSVPSAERRGWNQGVRNLREARGHDNATLSYVTFTGERLAGRTLLFSRRHLGPLATSFRRANRSSPCHPETDPSRTLPSTCKQWSYTEDNHPAQAWQHLEQHRDRAPRGPETQPQQGRCSSSIFRAETRTTRRTKRENTPPRRREKIGYQRTPYCGQHTKGNRTVITSPDP